LVAGELLQLGDLRPRASDVIAATGVLAGRALAREAARLYVTGEDRSNPSNNLWRPHPRRLWRHGRG
jgi:hypothetical protein